MMWMLILRGNISSTSLHASHAVSPSSWRDNNEELIQSCGEVGFIEAYCSRINSSIFYGSQYLDHLKGRCRSITAFMSMTATNTLPSLLFIMSG